MGKTMDARREAATTPRTMIAKGSPAESYQAINRAKMLWSFRLRDVEDWKEVIDRWVTEPKAWKRIPEAKPYGTARAMIEAEVCESYDAFFKFVTNIIGEEYAAKIADERGERVAPAGKLTTATKLLRQRLRSVTGQLDIILNDSNASDERRLINEGWVQALGVEQAFLTDLLARLEQQ